MVYPKNQVTVRSSETDRVFRINRAVAERHDTLTILDDETAEQAPRRKSAAPKIPAAGTKADNIAAPVADDNQ